MQHPHLQPWQGTVTIPLPACPKNKERASRTSVNTPEVAPLAELNELVDTWDLADEGRRLRSRTRTIGECFAQEQPLLGPLPGEVFETGRWFTPRVNRFGQITILSNAYSVPVRFIGRQLRVLLHANDLVVYDGRTEVARHERLSGRGGSAWSWTTTSKPSRASPVPSRARHRWNRPAPQAVSLRYTTGGGRRPAPRTAKRPAPAP
ncbi:Mu transposase domain-containing protein [Streptomyces tauricus]|uniref:Mu transposase domain-containing protein n=1 Tax=Streptomyces tauricus TaxID=68274 RepID=UPI002244EE23|nr:hypothetical protein [Streptomyces tauricus]MCW8103425.1 hypothetical protein [Streptomyces tauricus]